MARIKKGVNAKKKHKKILKLARGYYGAKSKLYRPANEAVMRALRSAYRGRKEKKRDYRKLWITRINAAARIQGMSYSKFMYGLKQAGVELEKTWPGSKQQPRIHPAAGEHRRGVIAIRLRSPIRKRVAGV